jgi:hypothetical protein
LVPGLKYGAFPYLLNKFFSEETTELLLASTSTTYTPVAHSAMPSMPIESVPYKLTIHIHLAAWLLVVLGMVALLAIIYCCFILLRNKKRANALRVSWQRPDLSTKMSPQPSSLPPQSSSLPPQPPSTSQTLSGNSSSTSNTCSSSASAPRSKLFSSASMSSISSCEHSSNQTNKTPIYSDLQSIRSCEYLSDLMTSDLETQYESEYSSYFNAKGSKKIRGQFLYFNKTQNQRRKQHQHMSPAPSPTPATTTLIESDVRSRGRGRGSGTNNGEQLLSKGRNRVVRN